jgi:hypothetical protein
VQVARAVVVTEVGRFLRLQQLMARITQAAAAAAVMVSLAGTAVQELSLLPIQLDQ